MGRNDGGEEGGLGRHGRGERGFRSLPPRRTFSAEPRDDTKKKVGWGDGNCVGRRGRGYQWGWVSGPEALVTWAWAVPSESMMKMSALSCR